MNKPLGYVIVGAEGLMFAHYKHPGTSKTGFPVWTSILSKAAIYDELKEAADIALSIFNRDNIHCSAKGLVLYE